MIEKIQDKLGKLIRNQLLELHKNNSSNLSVSSHKQARSVALKTPGSTKIISSVIRTYLDEGKEFCKNGGSDKDGKGLSGKIMSPEERGYFGRNLNNIDYKKMKSLNSDEIIFILTQILLVGNKGLGILDEGNIIIGPITLRSKKKGNKGASVVKYNILKNALLKSGVGKEEISMVTKVKKGDFQVWAIDKLRELKQEIPNLTMKIKKEQEVVINNNYLKYI